MRKGFHGLRGSASPVLTATVNRRLSIDGNFWPPTESTPLHRSPKNLLLVITSATPTAVSNLVQIRPRGLLGKWVKYNNIFIYLYFFWPSTDFHAWWLKRHRLEQGCAFRRFRWYCSFWGWNTPKTPILGAWIGVFKEWRPKRPQTKTATLKSKTATWLWS